MRSAASDERPDIGPITVYSLGESAIALNSEIRYTKRATLTGRL